MRVLLDENLPVELAGSLFGHQVQTVTGLGWQGIQNGELLSRMAGRFDALVTMDKNLKDQQPLTTQPFGVVLVRAASNRMLHLRPLLPAILAALKDLGLASSVGLAFNTYKASGVKRAELLALARRRRSQRPRTCRSTSPWLETNQPGC